MRFEGFSDFELQRMLQEYDQANADNRGIFQRKVDELAEEIGRRRTAGGIVTVAIDDRFRLVATAPDPIVIGATKRELYALEWETHGISR